MSMLRIAAGLSFFLTLAVPAGAEPYGLGRPATASEIAGWDIDVAPDGKGLPPGRGSVAQGQKLFAERCATCHGQKGEGSPADRLVGGQGSLDTDKPVRTVGSFWPYATTLFDYVRRAMPFDRPGSLNANEIYAVSAYILHLNGLLPADAALDATSLPKMAMPNRPHFVPDARPDIRPLNTAASAKEIR